ncbi:hypothetical protein ACYSNW_06345 [Enterococcus sp. LJL99]
MNTLKRKRSSYLVSLAGCAFFAALYLVKIIKNIDTISFTDTGIAFLFSVCTMICSSLYSEVNKAIKGTSQDRIN